MNFHSSETILLTPASLVEGNFPATMVAAIGIPDSHGGEKVKAFIQLKAGENATEAELAAFCKENLAGYKRPRAFEFRDALPVSAVGKVLRRALRDEEMGRSA